MSIFRALQGPVSVLYIMQFFTSVSLAGLEATFAYFAAKTAGLGTVELGYLFMIMGLAGAIVQGGLVGRLTKNTEKAPSFKAELLFLPSVLL